MSSASAGWTLADYATAYRDGASVISVIDDTLAALHDSPVGVLIGPPLVERARADAAALVGLDPSSLPLFGVPFVVKDNIDVGGVRTTAACPGYAYLAPGDATVVGLLRAAGAIIVGKANLDQFATGLVGTRSPYGIPPNVLDPTMVPGGSSSGSAVAVALGLVPFSLGTDTAGSGRVPAALNGIVGIKPTLGRASLYGIVPAVRRIDTASVFARNVADAAVVAAIISTMDVDCGVVADDPSLRIARPATPLGDHPVVGVPGGWPRGVELSAEMAGWFAEAVQQLTTIGCTIVEVDIAPLLEVGALLYGSSLVAERSAAVGEAVDKGVEGLDPAVSAIIASGNEYSAVDAYRTEYELTRLRARAATIWQAIDVLALPTTPHLLTLAEVHDDPIGANERLGRLTTFVNLLDLAAVVVPTRSGSNRVPAGLQLIAPAWQDIELERLANSYETGAAATVEPSGDQPLATLVVVGAHLSGLPLNHQLVDRSATLVATGTTSAAYRLHALAGTVPPKPGLVRGEPGTGAEIAVEVWSMGLAEFGSFVAQIPPPLSIGSVELSDGTTHKGFLCEPVGLVGAVDITSFGGWLAYLNASRPDASRPDASRPDA